MIRLNVIIFRTDILVYFYDSTKFYKILSNFYSLGLNSFSIIVKNHNRYETLRGFMNAHEDNLDISV